MTKFDVAYVRSQFPALQRRIGGLPVAYFDAPGGTQTPEGVLQAVSGYLRDHNANIHGFFAASEETDAVIMAAHQAAADLLGCDWAEASFGANMTTLCYFLADTLGRTLEAGDEVLITQLDHEANRGPWLHLRERGVVVREVPVDTATCTLDWQAFEDLVRPGVTKIVAVNYASNAVGTVSDVTRAAALARRAGAFSVVDAVHYALHGPIDVAAIGCDFLLCSAYKFFGPHIGILFARRDATARLQPLRLSTQDQEPPWIWETGTQNQEGMAGVTAAVDFIAQLGERHMALVGDRVPAGLQGRRRAVVAGMLAAESHEQPLAQWLRAQLGGIAGVTLYGPPEHAPRTSTMSFTLDGCSAEEACRRLGRQAIFAWDGHFYAYRLVERLGLLERGGLVRIGLAPYNTADELERLVAAVQELAGGAR